MNKRVIIAVDVIVVVALLVVAVVYFTHQANQLPSWFPGHSASDTKVHVKHGLAAVIVAIGAAIFGWFATGPKAEASAGGGSGKDGTRGASGSGSGGSTPQQ